MRKREPTVELLSTGRFLPDCVVTNDDLAKRMDTSDEWIRTRTGIRQRRIAPDDVNSAQMGANAARAAMERAGVEPDLQPPVHRQGVQQYRLASVLV